MTFGVLNGLMLFGLAAVALPVIAHLLSKRRYDVVHWGAMRFLELGQRTRQRIRIQDLLLLLLRMAVVACVALALARPWGRGAAMGMLAADVSRDMVFVIDGSTSMAWQHNGRTPHQDSVQWVHEALEGLRPGETATIIDARNQPRHVIGPVTGDWKQIRQALAKLPDPSGTSDIPAAVLEAQRILSQTANAARDIVILSDDQALPWKADDAYAWERVDDRRRQAEIPPTIRAVAVGPDAADRTNFSVSRIELSREITVPEFPVKIRAKIRQSGGSAVQRKVQFEVGGSRIDQATVDVHLLPDGESQVEFEHVFTSEGRFLVGVTIEDDPLPADNRADAVIVVTSGIPALIVDGDVRLDETKSESYFVKSVFEASGKRSPWIRGTVIRPDELDEKLLQSQDILLLCNVPRLSAEQWTAVRQFVSDGGGLIVAPGDRIDPVHWNDAAASGEDPLLPARFERTESETLQAGREPVTIQSDSLETSWLRRFRRESGVDFWQTRFSRWWILTPFLPPPAEGSNEATPPEEQTPVARADILGKLTGGAPLLVGRSLGDGAVLQLAVPLDSDWGTLPARNDFVPFLHEMVFHLTSRGARRNVDVGEPLLLELKSQDYVGEYRVSGPGIDAEKPDEMLRGRVSFAVHRNTQLPGIYRFVKPGASDVHEPFVVADDGRESMLTPLTETDWALLTADDRLERVDDLAGALALKEEQQPRAELWWLLLVLVLGMLIGEVALTRKMVQGGHAALDELEAAAA